MKSNSRTPIALVLATALLCLVLISASIASRMFARYIAKADLPDNPARTAAFEVSAQAPADSPVTIVANGMDDSGKAVFTVTVKNNSETAVEYEAQVVFPEDPTTHESDADKFADDNEQLSFTGYLAPQESKDETLTLDMSAYFDTNDKYATFRNDDMSGESGKIPFDVNVKFTQVN